MSTDGSIVTAGGAAGLPHRDSGVI
jgi:hypothetical protein